MLPNADCSMFHPLHESAMDWHTFRRIAEPLAGFILLFFILMDVFFTVLYARMGKGVLSKRVARLFWTVSDGILKHLGPFRKTALPLIGPLILVLVIGTWVLLLLLGLALVIHPGLGTGV